jgi:hypothetical protein
MQNAHSDEHDHLYKQGEEVSRFVDSETQKKPAQNWKNRCKKFRLCFGWTQLVFYF